MLSSLKPLVSANMKLALPQRSIALLLYLPPDQETECKKIKVGVFEIEDIDVVTKCDKPDVQKTIGDLKVMVNLGLCG